VLHPASVVTQASHAGGEGNLASWGLERARRLDLRSAPPLFFPPHASRGGTNRPNAGCRAFPKPSLFELVRDSVCGALTNDRREFAPNSSA